MGRLARNLTVLAVMTVALTPSAPAQAATALSLSASSGPAGASVTAVGNGLPQRSDGTLSFAGTTVGTFKTGRSGEFSSPFVVPNLPGVSSASVIATVKTASGRLPSS